MIEQGEGASASSPSRVFNVSAGQDTGGQITRLMRAFERHQSAWTMTGLATKRTYIEYPGDVSVGRHDAAREMTRLWNEADVVHAHRRLLPFELLDRAHRKPIVLNHHGSTFREDPGAMLRDARHIGAVGVVSTIDLLRYGDDLEWLPAPFQIDELAAMRRPNSGPVRIAHAPTNRQVKSTPVVLAAIAKIKARHRIEFDLIENVTWAECMARKARADILIDQFTLGYGCNAIEAWGMGIPVVAGTTDPVTRDRMLRILGELPFYEASETTLIARLEELIVDRSLREEWGGRGFDYAKRWHDDLAVMRQAEALYERAIAERKPVSIASVEAPRNRLALVRDAEGHLRRMTPAMAQVRGLTVEAVA